MLYTDTDKALIQNDKKNCTVRALALTCGVSYSEAYNVLQGLGRKHGRGFHIDCYLFEAVDRLNHSAIDLGSELLEGNRVKGSRITVKTIHRLPWINEGNYYVVTRTHALPVIDGSVRDHFEGKRSPILRIFKIEPKNTGVFELPMLGEEMLHKGLSAHASIEKDAYGLYWKLEIFKGVRVVYYTTLDRKPTREQVVNCWRNYNNLSKIIKEQDNG